MWKATEYNPSKIGHITCDNASNNSTMMREWAFRYRQKTRYAFDIKQCHMRYEISFVWTLIKNCLWLRCLAHIINLATQALISTRSKTKHFNPHSEEEHMPVVVGPDHDETGLVRAITVKVNFIIPQFLYLFPLYTQEWSSLQRKQHFKDIQICEGIQIPKQLILDMKIRWGSTYAMLNRAENLKKVFRPFTCLLFTHLILFSMLMFSFMNLELNQRTILGKEQRLMCCLWPQLSGVVYMIFARSLECVNSHFLICSC